MKYFKLVGSIAFFMQSDITGKTYSVKKDEVFSVDDADYNFFKNQSKKFLEVSKDGKSVIGEYNHGRPVPIYYDAYHPPVVNKKSFGKGDLSNLKGVLHPDIIAKLEGFKKDSDDNEKDIPKENTKKKKVSSNKKSAKSLLDQNRSIDHLRNVLHPDIMSQIEGPSKDEVEAIEEKHKGIKTKEVKQEDVPKKQSVKSLLGPNKSEDKKQEEKEEKKDEEKQKRRRGRPAKNKK